MVINSTKAKIKQASGKWTILLRMLVVFVFTTQQLPIDLAKAQSTIDYPWPNPRHDSAATAFASDETTLTPPLAQTFSIQTNKSISSKPSPLIAGGLVIVDTSEGICAYKISNQTQAWCFDGLGNLQSTGIANEEIVVVGQNNETGTVTLAGLDLLTGAGLWQIDTGQSANSSYTCSGIANSNVFCSIETSITGIDLATQGILWNASLDGVSGTPFVLGGQVFAATNLGTVYSLNSSTGELVWQISINVSAGSSLIAFDNLVVLGSADGTLHALNEADGNEAWTQSMTGNAECPAAYGEGALIVSSSQGVIERLDPQSGQVAWTYDSGIGDMGGCLAPVIANGYVYVNFSDGSLRAISLADGTLVWQGTLNGPSKLAISREVLLAVTSGGEITAFSHAEVVEPTIEPTSLPTETIPTEEPTLALTVSPEETLTLTPTVQLTEILKDSEIELQSACVPILISPTEDYTAPSPTITFSWESLPVECEDARYRIMVSSQSDMSGSWAAVDIDTTTTRTLEIDTQYYNQLLYWAVQVRFGLYPNYEWTDWSSIRSFHTNFPRIKISHNLPLFNGQSKDSGWSGKPFYFLPMNSSTTLSAVVDGSKVTNPAVTWSVQSGAGTFENTTPTTTSFRSGSASSDTLVRATSVQYPDLYDEFSIHTFATFSMGMNNPQSVLYNSANSFIFIPGMDEYEYTDVATRDLLGVTIEGGGSINPTSGGVTYYSPTTPQSTVFHLYLKPYPTYSRDITINTIYGGPINGQEQCFVAQQWYGSGGNSTANYPRISSIYYQYAPIDENSTVKLGVSVNDPADDPIKDVTVLFKDAYGIGEFFGPYHLQLESGTDVNGIWSGAIPFNNPICATQLIMKASNLTNSTQSALFAPNEGDKTDVPSRPSTSGVYDTSFNVELGADSNISKVVQQSDGKVLIVGDFTSFNGEPAGRIARLNSDGSLDTTFLPGIGADWTINTVALQPDHKILIGGAFRSFNGIPINRIARLNEDGSLDSSFDSGNGFDYTVNIILVQPDGKIFVGGNFSRYDGIPAYDLIRLNSDGSVDPDFNTGIGADAKINDALLLSDAKFLIVGTFGRYNGISSPHLARINSDGSLDQTFIPPFEQYIMWSKYYKSITSTASGNIYLTGESGGSRFGVIDRLSPDGVKDNSFTVNGLQYGSINSVSELIDGRVLIAGTFYKRVYNNISYLIPHLAMVNPDGSWDTNFTAFTNQFGTIDQLLPISDTNILAVGRFNVIDGMDSSGIASLSMKTPTTILSSSVPDARVDSRYNFQIKTMGVPFPTFTISSGSLPTGLTLDPVSGKLAGIPEESGIFTFTVSITNGIGPTSSKEFALAVNSLKITSISPSEVNVTQNAAKEITVNGTGFLDSDTVELDGKSISTTFISENQLIATIPPSELQVERTSVITVHSTPSGELISNGVELLIKYRTPKITSISPSEVNVTLNAVREITVNGKEFLDSDTVELDGKSLITTFINENQLIATIPPSELKIGRTSLITVHPTAPGELISNGVELLIKYNSPMIIGLINPQFAFKGNSSIQLAVGGNYFINGSIVRWNGSDRPTTYVNGYYLIAQIDAVDLTEAGSASITVFNPSPGGGTSNSVSFSVLGISPAIDENLAANKVIFDWEDAPDASQYAVQLSLSSTFSTNLINTTTTASNYNYNTALTNGKTYYWRFRPKLGAVWGDWTPAMRFYSMNPPVAPVQVTPLTASYTNDTTPELKWNAVTNGARYQVQISKAATLLPTLQDKVLDEGILSYTADELTTDGIYYWKVRAIDSVGVYGAWSGVRSFTVDTVPPSAPLLSAPANQVTVLGTPAYSWSIPSSAKAYIFEYDNDHDFSSPIIYTSGVLTTNKITPPLQDPGTYYWRVKARDAAGNWSVDQTVELTDGWSETRVVTIKPVIPVAPVLVSPASSTYTNDTTPNLTWKVVPYAVNYKVQLSKSSTFSDMNIVDSVIVDSPVLNTDVTTNGDRVYYWRVCGINDESKYGAWSSAKSFTMDTVAQAVPVMTSPVNGATVTTVIPKMVVKSVSGAKTYEYEFSTSDTMDPVIQSASTTATSYILPTTKALPFGTIYYHVRSVDAAGNPSAWSAPYSFVVTILKAPANKAVMVTSTTARPAFSWTAVSGATGYKLKIEKNVDGIKNPQLEKELLKVTSYTLSSLEALPIGKYEWSMCVKKGGVCSDYTQAYAFTVTPKPPTVPVLLTPASGLFTNDRTPELTWSSSTNAVKYEVQISKTSSFAILEQTEILDNVLTYIATEMLDGIHYWRVRAINNLDVPGPWSTAKSLTVDTVAPSAPTLSTPTIDAVVHGTPKYSWLAVTGAKYYQLEYASTADFSNVVYTSAEQTYLYLTPPQQVLGSFYWHVRSKDAAGNLGGWSAYRQITILPPLPVAPVLVAPVSSSSVSITTPTFTWNPVPYATAYDIQIDNNSNFSSPESLGAVSATWYTSSYLPNATYYWRVRAKNIPPESGAWSASRTVKVSVPTNSTTSVVSVSTAGVFGNSGSAFPQISENGRFVLFGSASSNMVDGDTNTFDDVFIHDQQTNVTSRVSISSSGIQANNASIPADVSEDGRFVNFYSSANNLVLGDTNGSLDVFIRDRQLNLTSRISVSSLGIEGNGRSSESSISGDGRYVVFSSDATNLAGGDTNGVTDVFLHDRNTGQTTRISLSSMGTQGNGASFSPSISQDGRFLTFVSEATNLVSGDTNGRLDIFVHDLITGSTNIVSLSSTGIQTNGDSRNPSISRDGRYVVFDSSAINLDGRDTTDDYDVYLYDMVTMATRLISVTSTGEKGNKVSSDSEISANGLFVAFMSCATNFVNVDTNGMCDIFIHDLLTDENRMASINSFGAQADKDSYGPSISGDGRYVSFYSDAWGFVAGDYHFMNDVFVHEFR